MLTRRKYKWNKKYYNRYKFRKTFKGVKEYNMIVDYFLVKDKREGKTYTVLSKEYGLEVDTIVKRIRNWKLNYE